VNRAISKPASCAWSCGRGVAWARHGHLSVAPARADVRRGDPGAAGTQIASSRRSRSARVGSRATRWRARRRDEELELRPIICAGSRAESSREPALRGDRVPGRGAGRAAVYRDDRGFLLETFSVEKYRAGGIDGCSCRTTTRTRKRGIAARAPRAEPECRRGSSCAWWRARSSDVVVEARRGSPIYGHFRHRRAVGRKLQADLRAGPASCTSFVVTSESAQVEYKSRPTTGRTPEFSVAWNDPTSRSRWPIDRSRALAQGRCRAATARRAEPVARLTARECAGGVQHERNRGG